MGVMLRLGVIGAGEKASEYARSWIKMSGIDIVAAAEVSPQSRKRFAEIFLEAGRSRPREFTDAESMLATMQDAMDAVYVSTPHAMHGANALAVVESGYDLLLEKPMVTTVEEALALADAERRTGRTIVIAFQGGLSPLVHETRKRASAGEFGELVSVSAAIWEGWAESYSGHWKQDLAISGGGFMFDTGAHMMNTVCVLAGAEFVKLSAFASNRGFGVDIATVVAARLDNGALVTFHAAGQGPPGCASEITFFYTKAIVRIDAWGGWREVAVGGISELRETVEIADTPMQTFQAVRDGQLENPSTVANGIRFAQLWDAIKLSATRDGEVVSIEKNA
ncbi:MAG: Gfo/Idh/MocA family oxidoreductase [Devosia sp.]